MTAALLSMATRGYGGAGIATDGSVGARQTIAGANAGAGRFVIPQTLGSVVGNNLFHSFAKFNIDTGQTADFTTSTAALANVISRVTGGSLSQINGTLRLTAAAGSAPAFFFINPAGVVFGAGAAISVPGAFHVSTADYVKFANGDKFHADLGRASTLSSAAPAAFGFLGTMSAPIVVKDGAIVEAQPSQPISVVAGDIEINNGGVFSAGGDIRVVSLGKAAQEIGLTGTLAAAFGKLAILNGGTISSPVTAAINGGALAVGAGSITIDSQESSRTTGILTRAELGTGNAGSVEITVKESLSIVNGGVISASTFSDGHAGTVDVSATGRLSIVNGGQISTDTFSSGDAGTVRVSANSIAIEGHGSSVISFNDTGILSRAAPGSTGEAGSVEVSAKGNLSIVNGGQIASSTFSSGDAGTVKVSAGSIAIDGQGSSYTTGILSGTYSSTGNAGSVDVTAAGNLYLVNGGAIASSTFSSGDAGTVRVSADSIAIEGHGNFVSFNDTGILSRAAPGSTGEAGSVEVSAKGNLSIVNGGQIASRTFSSGDAGTVRVSAGSIAIDGQESGNPTGIFSETSFSTGNAGSVEVLAIGNLSIVHGGKIASDNVSSPADSGTVTVSAGRILIDGQGGRETGIFSKAEPGSGNAGSINVSATGALSLVSGGEISADTLSSSGHAGTVKVRAGSLAIDSHGGSNETGIFSRAKSGTGSAGSIEVTTTGGLSLLNGGAISSSTFSAGTAGSVTVLAGTLLLDGDSTTISAAAAENSSGQTGLVSVAANDLTLSNGGHLSIENNANVEASVASALKPTSITVTAPRITLLNGLHAITTESTGNVAAGNIRITASDTLQLDPSGITTTAFEGNGGAIDITAGLLRLDHSQITTSVNGRENGNGGNIRITADSLILNTGFIQANTAAANASGGDVSITTQNLVASGNTLFLGGSTPHTFQPGVFGINVIQAAAPTGISGTVQISTPKLDVTSSLIGLDTRLINAQVARRLCENTRGSSLVPVGRGGLPLGGADFLSPGQISGIGFVTSPSVSLPTVRASLRTNAFTPCLAAL